MQKKPPDFVIGRFFASKIEKIYVLKAVLFGRKCSKNGLS